LQSNKLPVSASWIAARILFHTTGS